ncbi:cyclopropane-fatty-acyl-phospholipid synthase family protein [Gammaproteobacteria bacterium AB-CW1]|uniref:Cyclopropane-fatty-acyl-phospholipid synthase family protein n=1 Tax=Natronospira elongata TaxID=3110268 RepID=A0AAP6MMV9_9GAMM|nr:cyclopropane-fatty-acyl-phospholipid synthase family protein [Gammaproteobacteria bacterium AB-CW1]
MSASKSAQAHASARLSLPVRLLLAAARRLQQGSLEIHLPGMAPQLFSGPVAGPHGVLLIRDTAMFKRLMSGGDLGFAEAWMAGEWTSPDLPALLRCLDLNLDGFKALQRGRAAMRWLRSLRQVLLLRNNRSGSRRNIRYHYDLGNDFYRLWLDPSMTYSSGLFLSPSDDLETAQFNKYQRLLSLSGASAGDHILEIGCGWGSFAIHAARERDCRVTALTLSPAQYEIARARVAEAGLSEKVDVRLQDYRDVAGQFDHIVSIEMFEAVGEAYWPVYFRTLAKRLKPGGRAVIQVITIDEQHFDAYRRDTDFIREYIFPGGVLPSPSRFQSDASEAGLETRKRDFFGEDYARTLRQWAEGFSRVEDDVRKQGFDERFIRMWHYYLAYCEAGFSNGKINLMQTVLTAADGNG